MHSILIALVIAGCANVEYPVSDERQTVVSDAEHIGDAPVATDTPVEEGATVVEENPCEVTFVWDMAPPVVHPDALDVPGFTPGTTCGTLLQLRGIDVVFSGGAWVADLPDTRLGIGQTGVQPLSVYRGETACTDDDCDMTWSADVEEYGVYFADAASTHIGFAVAAFTRDEEIAEIAELWDEAIDLVTVTVTLYYGADGMGSHMAVIEDVLVITPE